jgi:ribosome-binding protein aMBF1 (putative translation factor)
MSERTRRRTSLGLRASAAVPLIWSALEDRGWSDARLGAEMREDSAAVSRLLYGDRPANRQQAVKLYTMLGIPLESWDQPCPVRRRKHRSPSSDAEPHRQAS